ncbi:hypothetical protein DRN43_00365 [Thermococci archaeon]|nr:MAG: hypothetical protein DRN43_00365 [Thermococci archaeon]
MKKNMKLLGVLIVMVLIFLAGMIYIGGLFKTGGATYQRGYSKPSSRPLYATETATASIPTATGPTATTVKEVVQRLKKDYYITIQDDDPIKVASDIKSQISSMGGYVVSENLDRSERRIVYYMEFRIPNTLENEQKLGSFLNAYNVKNLRLETQDVTSQYNQIMAEIESLETEKKQLLEFYNLSKDVNDLIMIENRIASINSRLNYLYLQKDYYEKTTNYITYHVTIESKEKPVFEVDTNFKATIYRALEILLGMINAGIVLLIVGSPVALLLIVGKKIYDRYHVKKKGEG